MTGILHTQEIGKERTMRISMDWKKRWTAVFGILLIFLAGVLFCRGQSAINNTAPKNGEELEVVTAVTRAALSPELSSGAAVSSGLDDSGQSGERTGEEERKGHPPTSAASGGKKTGSQGDRKDSLETDEKSADPDEKGSSTKKNADQKTNKDTDKNSGKKAEKKSGGKSGKKASSGSSKAEALKSPTPEASPVPISEPVKPEDSGQITLQIHCTAILDKRELWRDGIEEVVPENGIFYSGACVLQDGDSVYDILKRICGENNIALDSQYTPLYGSYYIKGIGNLYEFDCGDESGWRYSVNGEIPGTGCSDYKAKSGDKIVFFYDYKY